MRQDLQIGEVRSLDLEAPGEHIVITHDEHTQFALAAFEAHIMFALGNLERGSQLLANELIIKAVPFGLWPAQHPLGFQVFVGAARDLIQRLQEHLVRLAHFPHPHQVASEAVAAGFPLHIPIQFVVTLVVVNFPQVPLHTRTAQHGARETPVDCFFAADRANAFHAAAENRVIGDQFFVFVDFGREVVAEVAALVDPTVGQVSGHAAHAEIVVVNQACARGGFPQVIDHLPFAEDVEEGGLRTHIGQEGAKPQQVVGDSVQLQHDHADVAGAAGHFNAGELFGSVNRDCFVEHPGGVVPPTDVGHEHDVGAVFGDFLHAAMEIANDGFAVDDVFAVEGDDEPQHAVHGRVMGAHVHDHRFGFGFNPGHRIDRSPLVVALGIACGRSPR